MYKTWRFTNNEVITPGYYCLTSDTSSAVDISGTIEFKGKGEYVFFVDSIQIPSCGAAPYVNCHLRVNDDVRFKYSGANANDIYWVVGHTGAAPLVVLYSGAFFAGTVLALGKIKGINEGAYATLQGRLWSHNSIGITGNTVVTP